MICKTHKNTKNINDPLSKNNIHPTTYKILNKYIIDPYQNNTFYSNQLKYHLYNRHQHIIISQHQKHQQNPTKSILTEIPHHFSTQYHYHNPQHAKIRLPLHFQQILIKFAADTSILYNICIRIRGGVLQTKPTSAKTKHTPY